GLFAPSAREAIEQAYARGQDDEFIDPTVILPDGKMVDGDAAIFFNFRADRARQLTRALTETDFREFDRGTAPRLHFACFTQYKKEFPLRIAFPTPKLAH